MTAASFALILTGVLLNALNNAFHYTRDRIRIAARIDGSSAFVSATGPKRLVANTRSHTSAGSSSTDPTAAIPALCTRTSGAPIDASMLSAASAIEAASARSSRTPIRRGSC